jgi:hypothetical protein
MGGKKEFPVPRFCNRFSAGFEDGNKGGSDEKGEGGV